ncbi:MAG: sterol desaturase family protein [Methylophilaceae bacterium]|nr:sterol desaturase family protein [Methyloradius sp.]
MGLFKLEHSKLAYMTDFALYSLTVLGLLTYLVAYVPSGQALEVFGLVMLGLVGWTLIEYLLHRFVLHGLRPFNRWHAEHHQRPTALICAPTILSASLILLLIFAPALLATDVLRACALTLGVMAGYLSYAVTHHAIHHWRSDSAWLKQRKRWHALHHHVNQPGYYGVTSGFWDYLLASKHHAKKPIQRAKQLTP